MSPNEAVSANGHEVIYSKSLAGDDTAELEFADIQYLIDSSIAPDWVSLPLSLLYFSFISIWSNVVPW